MMDSSSQNDFVLMLQATILELFPEKTTLQLTPDSNLRGEASLDSLGYFAVLTGLCERLDIGLDTLNYAAIAKATRIRELYEAFSLR
jgi:acyl carrier protein